MAVTARKVQSSVATFRLPAGEDRLQLVRLVAEVCQTVPGRVVTVRSTAPGERGILFASFTYAWCFETTSAEPRDWMVECVRLIAGGDRQVSQVGHVVGQAPLFEAGT